VAFRNRNVVCPCNRHVVFCMNQLGGIGAGGVPGNSYMFAPGADGVNKNKILCGVNHKNIRHPSQFELIYSQDTPEKIKDPLVIYFYSFNNKYFIDYWSTTSNFGGNANYGFITKCYNSGSGNGSDTNCYNKQVVSNTYAITFMYNNKTYNVTFLITGYIYYQESGNGNALTVKFLNNPSKDLLNNIITDDVSLTIIKAYKSTYKVNV